MTKIRRHGPPFFCPFYFLPNGLFYPPAFVVQTFPILPGIPCSTPFFLCVFLFFPIFAYPLCVLDIILEFPYNQTRKPCKNPPDFA